MTLTSLAVLAALVAIAAAAAGFIAFRQPVARRLAARSVRRRPLETALVVFGSLLGTAIITGSLIVGDALTSSLRAGAYTQLGPIDETVTAPAPDSLPALRRTLSGLEDIPAVDGVVFGLRARGAAATDLGGGDPAVEPDVLLVELDFDRARDFGGDRAATGLGDTPTPTGNEVAFSADLADELDVAVGDTVSVFAYGNTRRLEVMAVLPRVGLAGYSTDLDSKSFAAFLPPGTLADLYASVPPGLQASPPVALAFVSNEGDVLGGAPRSDRVMALIRDRISALPDASAAQTKQQLLETAEEVGAVLSEVFAGIGAFAVVAGVLLLVNVFVMLAEERRSELGIMRAVGMRRGKLVAAFFLEGFLYAVAAALIGAAAGIGVGAAIVRVAEGISGGPAGFAVDLRFAVDTSTVVGGFLIGLLIALLTALATSYRISRLNIIRAIREAPEPPYPDRRVLRLAAGWSATVAGVALTTAAVVSAAAMALLLGPALLAAGLTAVLAQTWPRHRVVTALGVLLMAGGISAPTLVPAAFRSAQIGPFVVQGLVIIGAAVAVLAHSQGVLGRLVGRAIGGTASPAARLGLAYPLARPFRTTMTLAMYALVVFMLVLVSLLAQVFGGRVSAFTAAESGGYDVLVRSAPSNPLPPAEVRELDGVEVVAPLRHAAFNVEFRAPGAEEFRRWFASGYDRRLLATDPPALDRWLPARANERRIWKEVLDDPSTMIVSSRFLQEGGTPQAVEVGDTVDMRDPISGATARRTVVATMKGGFAFSGAFMSEESLTSVLGAVPVNRLYVALDPRADAESIAAALERRHIRHGVEARTFREIVAGRQQQNLRFFRLLQGYMMLGLLIGTAGLGVIMVRAVRERRREIGLLRSVGLQSRTVGRSFTLEAGFVALQGILVGATLATATAYQLIENSTLLRGIEVGLSVPWREIAVLLGVTLVAAVVAAAWPARRASHTRPAVALRTGE